MSDVWPALPYAEWKDTKDTLHMYAQIVGKTALSHSTRINHWWNCGLRVTPQGLETGPLYEKGRPFQIEFWMAEFWEACVYYKTAQSQRELLLASGMSPQDFLREHKRILKLFGIESRIWPVAVEVPNPVRFEQLTKYVGYDMGATLDFHRILLSTQHVLEQFRARFLGKASPVLFWWGTFDLAVTLFSGRPAPPREGADSILREAMSHEEMSFGWWPGDEATPEPYFYAYASPEPEGIGAEPLRPAEAFYSADKHEFFLPYEAVRTAADPDAMLLEFCQSVYDAGAKLADWDPALLRAEI